jgi:hypothetical protein
VFGDPGRSRFAEDFIVALNGFLSGTEIISETVVLKRD